MTVKELIFQLSNHCADCEIGYRLDEQLFCAQDLEEYSDKILENYTIRPYNEWYLEVTLFIK